MRAATYGLVASGWGGRRGSCADKQCVTYGQTTADEHLPVRRFVTPGQFQRLRERALAMGFHHVEAGPLVRSSYHAWQHVARSTR